MANNIEDFEKARQKHKKKSKKAANKEKLPRSVFVFRAFLVALVIILFAVVAAQTFANVTFSNISDKVGSYFESLGSGDGYPYSLNSVSVENMDMMGSDLLLLTDTNLTVLDRTAKTRSAIQHNYSNPQMALNNGRIAVYDRSGKNFRVQTKKEVLFEKELDEDITVCDVGKKGNVAVATIGKTSKSCVTVYNSSFNEVFKWKSANDYIMALALSPNGKSVAVATVNADTGDIYSTVLIFDFDKNEAVATFTYSGTAVVDLVYTKKDTLAVVGDNLMGVIKDNTVKGNDISYNAGTLSRYAYNSENGTFALFLSKFGSNSSGELRYYGSDISLVFSQEINNTVRWIDCGSKYITVLQDNHIGVYSKKGVFEGNISTRNDSRMTFVSDNDTYVLAISEIRSYKAKEAEKGE